MIQFNVPSNFPSTKTYVLDVIENKKYGDFGKYYNLSKEFLKSFTGAKEIILTHSATAALELAFQLIEVKNYTALMPSYTFSSTANAVLKNQGNVDWLDVAENDLCVDVSKYNDSEIKNKMFVPVHYGSSACDMTRIKKNELIIEDAAQSLGVFHNNQHVGTFGKFGALSFHNTKFIHSGFGGALLINDLDYFDKALEIFNRGTNRHMFQDGRVNKYYWTNLGFSGGNSDINFAILYSQLENLQTIIEKRKNIFQQYSEHFADLTNLGVNFQSLKNTSKSNYSSFYLLVRNKEERPMLIKHLQDDGISSQFHYVNLHSSPMGKGIKSNSLLPISESAADKIVRLPIYPDLKDKEVNKIISSVKNFYEMNS
jgi:dTDP-4-amino-4,6-dideoxygalactose transaminase